LNSPKNEQNAFHIDGDEDDSNTSGNEDKLMAAIKDDPDGVIGFLKQMTSGLYSAIDAKMKSTSLSSAYTVYNDKEMKTQKSELAKTIKKWEQKANDQEDYYYKKFAQMEKALTQMQSQTQNITGLFQ
jgi:flagellar hook-associated protein 2